MSNYLYVVRCNNFCKIGIATDVESRLAAMQTGNPYQLTVEIACEFGSHGALEQCLHQKFAA